MRFVIILKHELKDGSGHSIIVDDEDAFVLDSAFIVDADLHVYLAMILAAILAAWGDALDARRGRRRKGRKQVLFLNVDCAGPIPAAGAFSAASSGPKTVYPALLRRRNHAAKRGRGRSSYLFCS
jgi:hypothetical protein